MDKKLIYDVKIEEYEVYKFDCGLCDMDDNCAKSYSECRQYNKDAWNMVEKQIRKMRQEIFEKVINNDYMESN